MLQKDNISEIRENNKSNNLQFFYITPYDIISQFHIGKKGIK